MNVRTSRSTVSFRHPFVLSRAGTPLPAGDYEVVIEEELLQGLSFEAYRRTATFVVVRAGASGRTEMHPVTDQDLQRAIDHDRTHPTAAGPAASGGGSPDKEPGHGQDA